MPEDKRPRAIELVYYGVLTLAHRQSESDGVEACPRGNGGDTARQLNASLFQFYDAGETLKARLHRINVETVSQDAYFKN